MLIVEQRQHEGSPIMEGIGRTVRSGFSAFGITRRDGPWMNFFVDKPHGILLGMFLRQKRN